MKKEKFKYYSLKAILSRNATYNVIYGERSNGKTYAAFEYCIKQFAEKGEQMALIRRWKDDLTGKRGANMFANQVSNGLVEKYTKGAWTGIYYYSSQWFFSKFDEETQTIVKDTKPFAFGFALNENEHDKSSSYPGVMNIVFDEFIARRAYISDEFVLFMNALSTIIRERDNVKIFMIGNTINKFCPYFTEMGLYNANKMKQGTIDVYDYGNSGLTVAVEYCASNESGKKSDKYFAFNNSKLQMITKGGWELEIYPHLPLKYKQHDVLYVFYIKNQGYILQCNIIYVDDSVFVYIHYKTTPIKDEDNSIIYSTEYDPRPNWRRKGLVKPRDIIDKKLAWFFAAEKVFYQDNEIGEIVADYLSWAKQIA